MEPIGEYINIMGRTRYFFSSFYKFQDKVINVTNLQVGKFPEMH